MLTPDNILQTYTHAFSSSSHPSQRVKTGHLHRLFVPLLPLSHRPSSPSINRSLPLPLITSPHPLHILPFTSSVGMSSGGGFAQANIQAALQLLSVGAAEASPTCVVVTDKDRFMVNVGEGTQRLAMEHKVRLTRYDHIFITALTPEAMGGLPGMLLTMADCGKREIAVHGPVGLRTLLRATSHFMRREELKIQVREYGTAGPAAKGATLAMFALPLVRSAAFADASPAVEANEEPDAKRVRVSSSSSPASASSQSGPAVAWVGQTADILGKFDIQRAKELGIPAGPLYGKLKNGNAVALPDGRTIQPEEVVAPSTPGALFGMVHLQDGNEESNLEALPPPSTWIHAALGSEAPTDRHLSCIVHYTSAALVQSEKYRQWMDSFGSQTTHILAALPLGTHQSPFRAARLNNLRLHQLDPRVFPRAALFSPNQKEEKEEEQVNDGDAATKRDVVWGQNLLRYQLLPAVKAGLDESALQGDLTDAEAQELRAEAAALQVALAEEEGSANDTEEAKDNENKEEEEVEIVFLGTGSAIPSKYRNVSGIYIRIGGGADKSSSSNGGAEEQQPKGMLLDVGEGSLGQLASLYEGDALCQVLVNLRTVWISHPHADHHLGLMKVLVARRHAAMRLGLEGGEPPPILILAPRPVLAWLREFRQWDPAVMWCVAGTTVVDAEEYLVDVERMSPFSYTFLKQELGLLNLTNVVVHHCPFAFGVVLDAVAGWRLVYSGDTRPCERLVQAGKRATVLIHEATFESSKSAEAVERRHSTVDEALDIARRMDAKAVVLTHFSQRYPKFPVLPSDSDLRVCVAFDLMTLRFRDVARAAALLPALQKLFPSDEEERAENEAVEGT